MALASEGRGYDGAIMRWRWMMAGVLAVAGVGLMVWDGVAGGRVGTGCGKGQFLAAHDYSQRPRDREMGFLVGGWCLEDLASMYSGESGVEVILDKSAFARVGLSTRSPVTKHVPFVPVGQAFPLVMRQVDPGGLLSIYDSGPAILVSTPEIVGALRRERETRRKQTGTIRQALDQKVELMDMRTGMQLSRFLRMLSRAGGLRIEVDWRSLERVGVEPRLQVFVLVIHGTLEEALEGALLTVPDCNSPLTFEARDDRIIVRALRIEEGR